MHICIHIHIYIYIFHLMTHLQSIVFFAIARLRRHTYVYIQKYIYACCLVGGDERVPDRELDRGVRLRGLHVGDLLPLVSAFGLVVLLSLSL